ncbi:LysR family transcriptional regulator [Vreelandella venusta]|uniref:LysR family transcriptional regulator n=1 Tax=Halomonas hydrothermalis TaxID=115561 RepID=A0A6F8U5H7_9GAMM|nr:LysR family transcriptional regulator [Halomonas hydrothermalis]BCB08732.1 LysR family transcriptional regulator [Halomonas hydrothermalis]
MQFKSLRLFMAVAETGSFMAAAKQLHTVQSNVTTHIKKLEEELGAQLVHRTGGVRLTSAGLALLDYAERLLAVHDEALMLFQSAENATGQLRLGSMETTMALRLPPILAAYHADFPEVDMTLATGPTASLIEKLMDGQADGVFVAGAIDHHRYHSLKVFSEQLVLVSSTPMTSAPSSEELLTATFLAFRQGCSYRQRIELLLASQGINAVRVFEFGTLDAMLGCVAAGMGYTVLPRIIIEAHQHRFGIHAMELPSAIANIDTYFVTSEPATWSPALARFVDTLHQQARL